MAGCFTCGTVDSEPVETDYGTYGNPTSGNNTSGAVDPEPETETSIYVDPTDGEVVESHDDPMPPRGRLNPALIPNYNWEPPYTTGGQPSGGLDSVTEAEPSFDSDGYNSEGFDINGFDSDGYNSEGFDINGFDSDGYNSEGFDINGFDSDGYNSEGFDINGFDTYGYNLDGYNKYGFWRYGSENPEARSAYRSSPEYARFRAHIAQVERQQEEIQREAELVRQEELRRYKAGETDAADEPSFDDCPLYGPIQRDIFEGFERYVVSTCPQPSPDQYHGASARRIITEEDIQLIFRIHRETGLNVLKLREAICAAYYDTTFEYFHRYAYLNLGVDWFRTDPDAVWAEVGKPIDYLMYYDGFRYNDGIRWDDDTPTDVLDSYEDNGTIWDILYELSTRGDEIELSTRGDEVLDEPDETAIQEVICVVNEILEGPSQTWLEQSMLAVRQCE